MRRIFHSPFCSPQVARTLTDGRCRAAGFGALERQIALEAALACREAARWLLRAPATRTVTLALVPFSGANDAGGPVVEEVDAVCREGERVADRALFAQAAAAVAAHVLEREAPFCMAGAGAFGTVALDLGAGATGPRPVEIDIAYREFAVVDEVACCGVDLLGRTDVRRALVPFAEPLGALAAYLPPGMEVHVRACDAVDATPAADDFMLDEAVRRAWRLEAGLDAALRALAAAVAGRLLAGLASHAAWWVELVLRLPEAGERPPVEGLPLAALTATVARRGDERVEARVARWPAPAPAEAVRLAAVAAALVRDGRLEDLPPPAPAFAGWAAGLDPAGRLGLALQHHGLLAGPLAHPAAVLRVVPGDAATVRASTRSGRARWHARVGLAGLRRVLAAGLPLVGTTADGAVVDVVDARPAGGNGLWRVRYVEALPRRTEDGGQSAMRPRWGIAEAGAGGIPVVHPDRDALARVRRAAARRALA